MSRPKCTRGKIWRANLETPPKSNRRSKRWITLKFHPRAMMGYLSGLDGILNAIGSLTFIIQTFD
jgi:hypothetical protein